MHEHHTPPANNTVPKPTNGAGEFPQESTSNSKPDWLKKAIHRGTKRILPDDTGERIDLVGEAIERIAHRVTKDHPDDKDRAIEEMVNAWLAHYGTGENELRARIEEAFAAADRQAEEKPNLRTATVAKLFELFDKDLLLVGLVARNAMTLAITYTRRPPWKLGREWKPQLTMLEGDITRARAWFETKHRLRVSDRELMAVLAAEADESRFHPVRDYLEKLKWDGCPRLAIWLSRFLGAVVEGETDEEREQIDRYFSAIGMRFLISAVARAYEPGCKVDTMLILEGKQGAQKSTALRVLAKDWFCDQAIDIGNKDTYLVMRKAWIFEHGELESISKREASEVKAFLSRGSDHFRAPYAREASEQPRSLVFAGTVNDSAYLKDPTGSRRYWIVPVGELEVEALRHEVDQLWAEAVALYKQGEKWWLTEEEETTAELLRAPREIENPFSEKISYYVDRTKLPQSSMGERCVTTSEIIKNALRIEDSTKLTPQLQAQVTSAMQKLGWKKAQRRIKSVHDEEARVVRCFVKPAA